MEENRTGDRGGGHSILSFWDFLLSHPCELPKENLNTFISSPVFPAVFWVQRNENTCGLHGVGLWVLCVVETSPRVGGLSSGP